MRIDAPIITGSFSLNGDALIDLNILTTTGSNAFIGDQTITGSLAINDSATNFLIEGNSFGQTYLTAGGAIVLNPGYGGVEMVGSNRTFKATDITAEGFVSGEIRANNGVVSGSSQVVGILSSLNSYTSSQDTKNTTLGSYTGSNDTKWTSIGNLTGSYATTGSNTFYGTQVFSGSVFIATDLIVQGSSSIQYISASSVSIGTNIVNLNTATPSVRYAGISVQDSGSSAGVTGSMLWDSLCNRWIYSNPSTIGYSGGMLLSGPRASTLGSETTLTCNYIAKSGGGDHLYDSCIIDDGTTICINANLKGSGTITGTTIYGSTVVCSAVGKFTSCIDAGAAIFSANSTTLNVNTSTRVLEVTGKNSYYATQIIGGTGTGTSYGLSVNAGTNSSDVAFQVYNQTETAIRLFVRGDGNVGIGTTSPNFKTHISTGSDTSITQPTAGTYGLYIQQNSSGNVGGIYIQDGASNSGNAIFVGDNNGAARFVINTDGNVGIGTPSPSYVLEVCSNVADWASRIYNSNGAGNGLLVRVNNTSNSTTSFGVYNGTQYTMAVLGSGITNFACQVCSKRFIGSSTIAFGGLITGTQSTACQSIESLWALSSNRSTAVKGSQYGNGTWYIQGYTSPGNWIYYKFMIHDPVWFRAYVYLANYADTSLRKGCLQYSLDNSATWVDLANATNWLYSGTLDGSIALSGDSKYITLRWDSGGGASSLVGWNSVEFTACGSAFYSVNGLG